jgi:hypothetical protein
MVRSVTDPHQVDADPDPAFHFDADPEPTTHFFPDLDPSMLQNDFHLLTFMRIRILIQLFTLMRIRIRMRIQLPKIMRILAGGSGSATLDTHDNMLKTGETREFCQLKTMTSVKS